MKLGNTIFFWTGAALVFGLLLYVFSSILLPFVAGMALAYLLDPVADRLERLGLSRTLATALILVLFVLLALLALMIIVPVLGSQLQGLIANMPAYLDAAQRWLSHEAGTRLFRALRISATDIRGSLGALFSNGSSIMTTLLSSVWNGGQTLISVVSLLVVTPVVAFYMLLDWDRMVATVDDNLPRHHRDTIRALAREMNAGVAGFVRGQVSVSALLGLFYAVSLSLAGLSFGLLIGLVAGLISFIPYLGSIVGGGLAIGVALYQFWPDWTWIAVIAGIFGIGQFIEGNILQPKLIGSSVGLHPVWLMFALFAFGTLFGFVGLLIAVPAAASVAVLVRFAFSKYRESSFYSLDQGSPSDAANGEAANPAKDVAP
ncbi:AI-2E family transporter [Pleomorphomonas sp. JP5]|uniref:AI-2E family transporter n=1 Tax=Pleomorphomonas sp. JP5 TaxID=2942998 RepID=UPI002042C476|nr:AI-2E family transporter [Pleomorphomonas sp. JP5]MCM5558768.1 AI-2E family transporter [Pleomorphomonas sp. JP5]